MGALERGCILLAEDDHEQREVMREILEYEGFRVLEASTPSEVVDQLSRHPDVVSLDLVGVAEPQVMKAIRSTSPMPAVVLVTGDHRARRIASELGADGFVLKPYDIDHLVAEVVRAMRGRTEPAQVAC